MRLMCRVLAISVSGYSAWRGRQLSDRRQEDGKLSQDIAQIFRQGRGVYGSPRVHAMLRQRGIRCGRKRVARLMRQQGLVVCPKKRKVQTTDSHHSHPIAPNLLQRDFHAERPHEKWVEISRECGLTKGGSILLALSIAIRASLWAGR